MVVTPFFYINNLAYAIHLQFKVKRFCFYFFTFVEAKSSRFFNISSMKKNVRFTNRLREQIIKLFKEHGFSNPDNKLTDELASIISAESKRYGMEDALKISEEKYRTVFENTGTATCIVEKDGTISLANSRFAQLAGYTTNEIENHKTWMEFVVPEDLQRMQQQHDLRRNNREEALKEYEFRFVNKQQSIRYIHLFIDVIPETDKSVASLLDITERKRAEEKLKQYNKKLEQAEENARLGSWEVDIITGNTWWSKQMYKLLGFEQSGSAPGFDEYLKHVHPADQRKVSVVLENIKNGVITPLMEYRGNPDFTGQRYLLSRAEGVKDQTGMLIKITGTVLDITDHKLIENEISKLKQNLEEQVNEKTNQLQERIDELERYRDATVEREFRMKELRDEIERLKWEKND